MYPRSEHEHRGSIWKDISSLPSNNIITRLITFNIEKKGKEKKRGYAEGLSTLNGQGWYEVRSKYKES